MMTQQINATQHNKKIEMDRLDNCVFRICGILRSRTHSDKFAV
jgi:hypothetical protein